MAYFWNDTLALFKREMLIFKSNLKANIIRSIIFPLTLILFLGNIGGLSSTSTNIAIVNYATSVEASQFISTLEATHSLKVISVSSQASAIEMLRNNQIYVVVVIMPSFPSGNPSVYLYYSNNFVNLGTSIQTITSIAEQFAMPQSRNALVRNMPLNVPSNVSANPTFATNISYKSFLIAGIIIMVSVFGAMFGGGMSIITDRQLGNLKAFLIAPIDKRTILVSKMLYTTVLSVINATIALILGILDGASFAGGITGLAWVYALVVMVSVGFSALSLLFATRIPKIEIYSIITNAVILPLWFISGAFFPTSSLPSWLYPLSQVDPLTYATNGIRDVMLYGYYPTGAMTVDFAILGAFAIVMMIMSFKALKSTLQ
ncbi:MAG: ABC transporter permease [Candidatus Micrarchaeia archaeon]